MVPLSDNAKLKHSPPQVSDRWAAHDSIASVGKKATLLKRTFKVLITLLIIQVGCQQGPTSPYYGQAIVEGTVGYYPPTIAIGGEADPSGFILNEYRWVWNTSSTVPSRLYIEGIVDSSYLNVRVRLSGQLTTLSAGGVETRLRHFPFLHVQTLQIVQ